MKLSLRNRLARSLFKGAKRLAVASGFSDWDDFWFQNSLPGSGVTTAGVDVNPDSAMRSTVVTACIRLISSCVAMLPVFAYERLGENTRRRADEHSATQLLHTRPNEYQTPYEFKQEVVASLAARGNSYVEKVGGQLWPIHNNFVNPEWFDRKSGRRKVYDISSGYDGVSRVLRDDQVWQPMLMSLDNGLTGASPIRLAAEGIGMALAGQIYANRFFSGGGRPLGYLKTESNLEAEEQTAIKAEWEAAYGQLMGSRRTPLLSGDLDYKAISISNQDAQLVDTLKFSVSDLARIWGIPLFLVQETEKSTSWGTGIEQISIGFVTYTLSPWIVLLEEGASLNLVVEPEKYFVEFSLDALVRGDLKSRFAAYAQAVNSNNPWVTRNEIRAKENMDPDNDSGEGDDFLKPENNVGPGSNGSEGVTGFDDEDKGELEARREESP